jgi:hypothetical protein
MGQEEAAPSLLFGAAGALIHAVFQQREPLLRIADPRSAVAQALDQILVEVTRLSAAPAVPLPELTRIPRA